jgi:hypothetical protein
MHPDRASHKTVENRIPPVAPSDPAMERWFDTAPPPSSRRPSQPPPSEKLGEFLGDPLADAWLR